MAETLQRNNTEEVVQKLAKDMEEIPNSMRAFSVGMRALYAEKEVSSRTKRGKEFNKLRDDTKRDALVYIKGILPISTTLVRSLKEFFEYYQELDMDDWKKYLSDIIEEVKGYKQCCEEIVHLHEDILASLKMRQDKAKKLLIQFEMLEADYEKKKKELEEKAVSNKNWAWGLFLIPGINLIATPLLLREADKATAESVACGLQCTLTGAAALVISDTMVPSLQSFINGIAGIAGFFKKMEMELTTFQETGEKAQEKDKDFHYNIVRKMAPSINSSCKAFFAVIPSVRSDFMSIPDPHSDQNYVDRWLERKKQEISKKYQDSITSQLSKLISKMITQNECEKKQ